MSGTTRDALWESGHDESVEVNQRALIDKVLARYSGEFTVFRELLQNSDDAASRAVEIHFETQKFLDKKSGKVIEGADAKLPELTTAQVHQWTFKNNGILFRDEDWSRLKKIAEGNPDEEKIGAFGVGFYSLFSVTEEPFVTSGGQWMGFYWKDRKDQLFARRGTLPDVADSVWTTFEMVLREPTPIPAAFDFTRFLVSSITFMAHLSEVSVFFDDKRLARLTKDTGIPKSVHIPRGLRTSSTQGLMKVKEIKTTPLIIKAEIMKWVYTAGTEKPRPVIMEQVKQKTGGFFSSIFSGLTGTNTPQRAPTPLPPVIDEKDLLSVNESSVVLSIFTADVDVELTKKMSQEIHRSTKKNPPAKLKYELIYTGKDEYDASKKEDEAQPKATGSVFQGLRADLDGSGSARVFIGHATAQTTGLGGHMAARFIPTVERESLDLVDRNVAVWNKELLSIGGFLSRSAYEVEMAIIQTLWDGGASADPKSGIDPDLRTWLRNRSLHALQFFTFHPSTPSSVVASEMRTAFFACASSSQPFPIISSCGIRNARDVRMPDLTFSGFLKELPVFPDDLLSGAQSMVAGLREKGMLKDISFLDVLHELRARPLSEPEIVSCLKWWIDVYKQGDHSNLNQSRMELLSAAVLTTSAPDEKMLTLFTVETFLNPRSMVIPTDGPLPEHMLPVSVGRNFDSESLVSAFPWRELTIKDWVRHIADPVVCSRSAEFDINTSAPWAERVLLVLARTWPSLSKTVQAEIVDMLKEKTCIPTSVGMKVSEQSYFSNADIFHDLPVVTLPSGTAIKAPVAKVLEALGVRKHVDLQVIFDRMVKTGDWTIADLTKYLVSVQTTLTPMEFERLKMTTAFPKERIASDDGSEKKVLRSRACDLYEPLDVFRDLGLPLIDWGTQQKWKGSSEEAKFLYRLGLRRFPSSEVILALAASQDVKTRTLALNYFLDNFVTKYSDYNPSKFSQLAFVPALVGGDQKLVAPTEVFATADWALMGFPIVDPNLRPDAVNALKIKAHPSSASLISLLEKSPPRTEAVARQWFGVLGRRISDFSSAELNKLSKLSIVPTSSNGSETRLLPPSQCYFSGPSSAQFHSKLFVFVDFGTTANGFLSVCGTKREPSVEEIAQILLANPRRFYELADGRENFLVELRNISINRRLIQGSTISKMKQSPVLLALRRVKKVHSSQQAESLDAEDDDWDVKYDLLIPGKIVIADDTNAFQLFGDSVFSAPQEDLLEEFYLDLGSKRLSTLVKEEYKTSAEIKGQRVAAETRSLILERLPLFLHEHTHTRTRVTFSWLNNEHNFIVKTFGKLTVTKALKFVDTSVSKSQDASAAARMDSLGRIQLWLAGNSQVDMYEVATSLCRLLFDAPKVNDALLFMTILSTDLRALKRRGYNVDRILRQQKAEREEAEKADRERIEKAASISTAPAQAPIHDPPPLPSKPQPQLYPWQPQQSQPVPSVQSLPSSSNISHDPVKEPEVADTPSLSASVEDSSKHRSVMDSMQTFKRKFASIRDGTGFVSPTVSQGNKPQQRPDVTPLSSIASNIDMAIRACRGETGNVLENGSHMEMVKETLNEGYCDISGRMGDLVLVGEMSNIKLYASKDVPQPSELLKTKRDTIERFSKVIMPIRSLYQLPATSIHIFYDLVGETIAFNRNASIFLNLRYYEAWHDDEVRAGDFVKAYTAWYFSLAHEIAHNLVGPHNSEHEFYFSSICQNYLPGLSKLILQK